jgi:anaerobic magnesium-protoporphyrin IX monomethyl ester cyclase
VRLDRAPASRRCVLLVGYQDQDNLGLRYLSARLREAGYPTRIATLTGTTDELLAAMADCNPILVGFSLIFQFLVPELARLLSELRDGGASAHFTVGGHYPSFEPERVLAAVTALDSVVRFEGESALVELVDALSEGRDPTQVPGLLLRAAGGIVETPSRGGIDDLDSLPWPDRDDISYSSQALPMASILGGRGCPWRCSFCSIVTFYEQNGTRGRRRRKPERIVDEMEYLAKERGVRLLLWQDDDFLSGGRAGVQWAHDIAREATRRGLQDCLRWKISCRSDEVSLASLAPLVAAGLTHVYMGVESGNDHDLQQLNKRMKADQHFRAKDVLTELGVSFDFGFMLLEPWSTFASARENVAFLRAFAGDGSAVVTFCRTLPYAGTPIEHRLREEGRIDPADYLADYRFLDGRLDAFYDFCLSAFSVRGRDDGTTNMLRSLLFEAKLRLPGAARNESLLDLTVALTSVANMTLVDALDGALDALAGERAGAPPSRMTGELTGIARAVHAADRRLAADLTALVAHHPSRLDRANVTR